MAHERPFALLRYRRFGDDEQTGWGQEWSGAFGHHGGRAERPGHHGCLRAAPARTAPSLLGPCVQDLHPVAPPESCKSLLEGCAPTSIGLEQNRGAVRPQPRQDESGQTAPAPQVEPRRHWARVRSLESLGEAQGVADLLVEIPFPEKPKGPGTLQRAAERCGQLGCPVRRCRRSRAARRWGRSRCTGGGPRPRNGSGHRRSR